MKAFLSDPDKRSRWLDHLSTHYTATIEETGLSPEDWVLNTAWGEARAILAVTEPDGCGTHQRLTWLGDWSADMAESVALFLGQAFPGEQCHCAAGHHWSPERGYFDCGGIVPA